MEACFRPRSGVTDGPAEATGNGSSLRPTRLSQASDDLGGMCTVQVPGLQDSQEHPLENVHPPPAPAEPGAENRDGKVIEKEGTELVGQGGRGGDEQETDQEKHGDWGFRQSGVTEGPAGGHSGLSLG